MTAAAVAPNPRVVLIDLSAIFYRAWHATAQKNVSDAFNLTLQDVRRCAKPEDLVAICCDSETSFRKELYPEYKANRPEKDQQMLGELHRVKERLVQDGYLLWTSKGFEADDVVATACEAALAAGHEVLICSADKDLMQLVGHGVRYRRTDNGQEGGAREVLAKFGVGPSLLGDYLAIVGDDGDNIKGAPGVGAVHAAEALKKWGSLTALGLALEKDIGACGRCKPKRKDEEGEPFAWAKSINDNWAGVMLARKLVELRKDVPISFAEIYGERQQQQLEETEDFSMTQIPPGSADSTGAFTSKPTGETGGVGSVATKGGAEGPGQPTSVSVAENQSAAPPGELPPAIAMGELVEFKAPQEAIPLAIDPSVSFERQLEPRNLNEALTLAKCFYNARLYPKFSSSAAIFTAIVRGREMGFPAGVSMDLFHWLEKEGRLCLTSNAIQTVAERLPDCEWIRCVRTDDKAATWETKHRKHVEPQKLTYTVEEAVQAGLCSLEAAPRTAKAGEKDSRGNWDKRRQNMLRKTCRDNLIRMVYPSAAALYSAEEMGADIND